MTIEALPILPMKLLLKRGCVLSVQVNKQVIRFSLNINQVRNRIASGLFLHYLRMFLLPKGAHKMVLERLCSFPTKGKRALK